MINTKKYVKSQDIQQHRKTKIDFELIEKNTKTKFGTLGRNGTSGIPCTYKLFINNYAFCLGIGK